MPNGDDPLNLRALRARLDNLEPLLEAIGALLVEQSDLAFAEQRLGEFVWAERYPSQDEPFINIAAALRDLDEAPRIFDRRFDRRPALVDTQQLVKSIQPQVTGEDTVVAGTTVEYAPTHQHGLDTLMLITETMRNNLAIVLSSTPEGSRKEAIRKLRPVVKDKELITQVGPRPFLGTTDQLEQDVKRLTEDHINGRT